MTYQRVCNKSNTTGEAGTSSPFRSTWVYLCFLWSSCCSIFTFLLSWIYK